MLALSAMTSFLKIAPQRDDKPAAYALSIPDLYVFAVVYLRHKASCAAYRTGYELWEEGHEQRISQNVPFRARTLPRDTSMR